MRRRRHHRFLALLLISIPLGVLGYAMDAKATVVAGDPGYQEWVDAITRVPTPTGEIEVTVDDSCGGLGCSDLGRTITLSPFATRKVFLHELGHVFDGRELTDGDRGRFIGLTGDPTLTWWDAPTGDYERMAGEMFADVYAICAGARRIDRRWEYTVGSGLLLGWRVQRSCGLIRAAATT